MKKILLVLFIFLSLLSVAKAGEIGPPEGGHCDTCSVWIEEVVSDGGVIYTAIASGILEGNYLNEVMALAEANCKLRGMEAPLYSEDKLVHMGFWKQTRARGFGCRKPSIYIERDGMISAVKSYDFDVQKKADAYCNSFNIKRAVLPFATSANAGIYDKFRQETRYYYQFSCSQDSPESSSQVKPVINQQPLSNPPNDTDVKLTITKAKEACEGLGFKAKTEKFGKCVLELIK